MFSQEKSQPIKTGYPSIDKPWNQFYEGVERKDLFLNTTPYIGLIKNNKNHLTETAIEYFGANVLVAGTAILMAKDYKEIINDLKK